MCNIVIQEEKRFIFQEYQSEAYKSFCTIKEDDKTLKLYSVFKGKNENSWSVGKFVRFKGEVHEECF